MNNVTNAVKKILAFVGDVAFIIGALLISVLAAIGWTIIAIAMILIVPVIIFICALCEHFEGRYENKN